MFLLFGSKKKLKQIKNGEIFREQCPKCGARATFVECEVKSSLDFFFVDVMEDTKRVMVCTECQEQFSVEGDAKAKASAPTRSIPKAIPKPAPAPATAPGSMGEAIREFDRVRRDGAARAQAAAPLRPARKAAVSSREIEDRLAALKRRMNPK